MKISAKPLSIRKAHSPSGVQAKSEFHPLARRVDSKERTYSQIAAMRLTTKSGEQLQRVLLSWSRARDDVKRRNEFEVRLHCVFDNGREILLRPANPGTANF
jgi:hypothetical protein